MLLGICVGAISVAVLHRLKWGRFNAIAGKIIENAEKDARSKKEANDIFIKQRQLDQQRETDNWIQEQRCKLRLEEERVAQREDKVELRMTQVDKKLADLEQRESLLKIRESECETATQKALHDLSTISSCTSNEAKKILLDRVEKELQTEMALMIRQRREEAHDEADYYATKIITTAIQRLAVPSVAENTVNSVSLPNDEIKGRIIGKEGRNIRTLEQATGVTCSIDDTPGAVLLSSFDPIRLHVAKSALTELIADGRIYPTRIEEVVEKAQSNVQKQIKLFGEDAALRIGVLNLHPELTHLLGKLKFRYSFGQNVLDHSLEVSNLMGLMAAELGLNVSLAKRIGLLHDIGKAVSHEREGSHAVVGYEMALKYGESQEVANGIGCHHFEMEAETLEATLCSSADAISASRPGVRVEAVEAYIKRLHKLEAVACSYPGVEKVFAMQAGRELRIIVTPEVVDDSALLCLVREISRRIEKEVDYPGKIRVTATREKRVVDYATKIKG